MTTKTTEPDLIELNALRAQLDSDQREVEAIRQRAKDEYRHEPGEQYTPMLRDLRFILGELNIVTEFWDSAEKELDEIRDCDKCDLCEDHRE